jgi:hypothetical protein
MNQDQYQEEETRRFLEELERFFDISRDRDRLRVYDINVIGSGGLAVPYVYALTEDLLKPNSVIRTINWWTREKEISDKIFSSEELKKKLYHRFNVYCDGRMEDGGAQSYKIRERIQIKPYRSLTQLQEIVKSSSTKNPMWESDLTVILNRYDTQFLFNNIDGEIKPKTREELEKLNTKNMMLDANTLFYKELSDEKECIETLIKGQEQISEIREILNKYCEKNGRPARIGNSLIDSLIGNAAFAKALRGYNGTVINMANPVEIVNMQFASHSNVPINRIFAPTDNDYARLHVILKDAYKEVLHKEFAGKLYVPPIIGPHNEFMTVDRNTIFFDDKTFDETFEGKFSDNIFGKIITELKRYGTDYKERYGESPIDTVHNSLIPATMLMLYEKNSSKMRGCIYSPDHRMFTDGEFTLQRGHVQPQLEYLAKLPQDLRTEIKKATAFDTELIKELSAVEGVFDTKGLKIAKVPNVPPEIKTKTNVWDMMEKVLSSNGKIAKINVTAYFRSAAIDNRHAVNKYRFNGSINPEITRYQLTVPDVNIAKLDHVLRNTQINSFDAQGNRLVIVSERGHSDGPTDYHLHQYQNSSLIEKPEKIILGANESIKEIVLNNDIYMLIRSDDGKHLFKFDKKMRDLGIIPSKECKKIVPYKSGVAGFFRNEVYYYDKKWQLLTRTDNNISDIIQIDTTNNIMYYMSDASTPNTKTFVAHDLERNISRTFDAQRNGFRAYSDDNGIQIWTILGNAIKCADYNSKRNLFENNGSASEISTIPIENANIWTVQRDIATLSNGQYIDSYDRIHGDKNYLSLLIKNNNRILPISVGAVRQYYPAEGVLK